MKTSGDVTASVATGNDPASVLLLLTAEHSTLRRGQPVELRTSAGDELVVGARSVPGSQRQPDFGREQIGSWPPAAVLDDRWEQHLGGHQRPVAGSANTTSATAVDFPRTG